MLKYGDIATLSFHATKIFHTVEGGAVITSDSETAAKIESLRNFGFKNEEIVEIGVNAKNSELHAAMGLSTFDLVSEIIQKRKHLANIYDTVLHGAGLSFPKQSQDEEYNYAYYPVVFESEYELIRIKEKLQKLKIESRRYFYPSLNKLSYINGDECKTSEKIAKRVLCLPLYYDLSDLDCMRIGLIVKENLQ